MSKIYYFFALIMFSVPAFAWVEGVGVTIDEVVMWEEGVTENIHFKLSNGKWCYIPGTHKNLTSLVLAVNVSGKKVNVHCHDTADQNAGGSLPGAHRLHRIISLRD